jgi:hypothetical protein
MLILVSILLLSISISFAKGDKDKISKKEFWNTLSGTWVNTEYLGTWEYYEQKLIVYPDGKFEYFPLTTDTDPSRQGYFFTLTEVWIDSKGVMWYKGISKVQLSHYELGKISASGDTWECIADSVHEPTEWDTSKSRYEIDEIRYCQ